MSDERRRLEVRDQADPLRRRARPGDQRPRDADLQDDVVRVQQRRARARTCSRSPSSATSTRASEPDAGRRRGARRRARGRHRRPSLVASGQAAETFAVLNIAQAGDHIVSSSSIYGGTYNLFKYTLAKLGIETTFVENQDDAEEWRARRPPEHQAVLRRDHRQPEDQHPRHRAGRRRRARERACRSSSTTRSRRRTSSVRSSTAPTSSCTRPPSSSAATARSSAASSSTAARSRGRRTSTSSPGLTEPDPSYHGASYTTVLGDGIAYIIKARVQLLRDLGAAIVARQRVRSSSRASRRCSLRIERHVQNAQEIAEWLENHADVATRELLGPAVEPVVRGREQVRPQGRRRGAVVRAQGRRGCRPRAGRQRRRCSATSRTSATCAALDHPPGVDDALAAHPRAAAHHRRHAGPGAALGRASRTSTTSRPTSRPASPPRAPPRGRSRLTRRRRRMPRAARLAASVAHVRRRNKRRRRAGGRMRPMDWQTPEDAVPVELRHGGAARRRSPAKPPATGAWREGDDPGDRTFVVDRRRSRSSAARRCPASRIAYETWGELNADARQRDPRAARPHRRQPRHRRRRARRIRPPAGGRASSARASAIDTDRWFVVAPNMLGGCQGSTGPGIARARRRRVGLPVPVPHDPRPGRRAGAPSPTRSASTAGPPSSAARWAAMQALEWAIRHPERVERIAVLAAPAAVERRPDRAELGADRGDPHRTRRSAAATTTTRADGEGPHRGLALARRMALLNYRSPTELNDRFERSWQSGAQPARRRRPLRGRELPRLPRQQVHPPLRREQLHRARRGDELARRRPRPRRRRRGARPASRRTRARARHRQRPALPGRAARRSSRGTCPATSTATCRCVIDSPFGHDAFLIEDAVVGDALRALLDA